MATAILLAKDVIEKFFGQNTGIKQNLEKIELHPTISICPFLNQCVRPIILRLQGDPKEKFGHYEGSYSISSYLLNGKPYWTHDDRKSYYIGYNIEYKAWEFGPDNLIWADLNGTAPYESTTWYYYINGRDIPTTTDIVVELGL